MTPCWAHVCDVDVAPLAAWLQEASRDWREQPCETKPSRLWGAPGHLVGPIVDTVLRHLQPDHAGSLVADQVWLSRMRPGQHHPMHTDNQHSHWVTRVHVPVITNERAWIMFEEEGRRVYLDAGQAYEFDTLRRHAFGNDGTTDRVHLLFDVLEV